MRLASTVLQEGNSLCVGWEKKLSSLLCILRENKNLSVCFYEKISHFVPAGGEKREKKNTHFPLPGESCLHTQAGPHTWHCRLFPQDLHVPCFPPSRESIGPGESSTSCVKMLQKQTKRGIWLSRFSSALFRAGDSKVIVNLNLPKVVIACRASSVHNSAVTIYAFGKLGPSSPVIG